MEANKIIILFKKNICMFKIMDAVETTNQIKSCVQFVLCSNFTQRWFRIYKLLKISVIIP